MKNAIFNLIESVGHNESKRFNCPVCNGFNTLSITKEAGKLKYHCFKASCNLNGQGSYLASTDALKLQRGGHRSAKEEFQLPDYLIYGNSSKKCLSLLNKTHCLKPYNEGLFEVAYDPKLDRICFLIRKNNEIVGMVGRACNPDTKPKVLNYKGSCKYTPFRVGTSKTLVLVEDCPSAASVARIPELSGMALLGTNLKDEYVPAIKLNDLIYVAMDRDARKKTLDIWNRLKYYGCNVRPWLLDRDIKDQEDQEFVDNFKRLS